MSDAGKKSRGRAAFSKFVVAVALLAVLFVQRHRLVEWVRQLSILPGGVDRAAAAAARVKPLLEAELESMGLKLGDPVFLRVIKEEQVIEVWMQAERGLDYVHYKTYLLCRPAGPAGPRVSGRDLQLPEGFYGVTLHSLRPWHRHYLAFEMGYPNAADRQQHRPGRAVLVQGDCVGAGSLALNNPNMEELYTLVAAALAAGQGSVFVHLFPFRLTDSRMNQELANQSPWIDFWGNLKEGYDYFEIVRQPPSPSVKAGRYGFE